MPASAPRRTLGALATAGILVLVAATLAPVWILVRFGVLAALASARLAPGDPTWNDGDLGIGLGFGALGLVVVLGLGAVGCALVGRWASLRRRTWGWGLAAAAVVGLVVALLATGI